MKAFHDIDFYQGEYVMADFINAYESRVQPSMLHITNTIDYHTYFRYFLQRAISLIIFDGLPDFWEEDYFTTTLFLKGNLAVFDTVQFGVIPQGGSPYGINVFYHPTNYIVANPAFNSSQKTDLKIGVDCEIVNLTPDWCGIGDLIASYAQRVALILSDIDVAAALAKFGFIFVAKNKGAAETFKIAFDDIMSGNLAVAINQSLYDKETGKPLYEFLNNDVDKCFTVVTNALAALDSVKAMFDREIGLYSAPEKRERLITDEIASTQNAVMSKCELWVETLNRCFRKVNQKFSLNITARLRYPKGGVADAINSSNR